MYAGAYFRQLRNSIRIRSRSGRQEIADAFMRLPEGTTVRLYVDGDFDSKKTLRFWMELCKVRSDLTVYGYSKSWKEFLSLKSDGYIFPSNYVLNLSSGSRHGGVEEARMKALPITRGSFVALKEGEKVTGKQFKCPGKCGDCLPKGVHACGSKKLSGVTVTIPIH